MTLPLIAAQTGAFLIVLQMILKLSAGFHRAGTGQGVGVQGDRQLERKVRRHGNLAENAGLFVAVLATAELAGLSNTVLGALAVVFVVARILHATGFSSLAGSHGDVEGGKAFKLARFFGAIGTALSGIALGLFTLAGVLL